MNSKKSIFRLVTAVLFVCVLAGTFAVEAATEFTPVSEGCKDAVNDGITFTTAASISGSTVEVWRDRIQVTVTDPDGIGYTLTPPAEVVQELTLYAASNNNSYQCQQLTDSAEKNDFSCNSFPAGGTIARINIRFVPNYQPSLQIITGNYTINILNLNTGNTIFSGTAKVDAKSTACAWNQVPGAFIPTSGSGFVYELCKTDPQTLTFLENSASPFTIVSFPLGETINPTRFVLYGNSVINEYDYALVLEFKDKDNSDLTITYEYSRGTDPKSSSNPVTPSTNWPGVKLPVRLVSGYLMIDRGTTPVNSMPQKTNFSFTFYYRNEDPTLGYENSMFHFIRTMTVEFSPYCSGNAKYKMSPTAY
ncbi:MAG TPA: hypothetical protein PKJ88_10285, partial [Flexilinea sp.]|nr:hypothetical protein [Flexilinea sp.]